MKRKAHHSKNVEGRGQQVIKETLSIDKYKKLLSDYKDLQAEYNQFKADSATIRSDLEKYKLKEEQNSIIQLISKNEAVLSNGLVLRVGYKFLDGKYKDKIVKVIDYENGFVLLDDDTRFSVR
jgi:cell shape-determining protein MreC